MLHPYEPGLAEHILNTMTGQLDMKIRGRTLVPQLKDGKAPFVDIRSTEGVARFG